LGNANAKKDDLCVVCRFARIARKPKSMRTAATKKQFIEMRLIDGKTAFFEQTHQFCVAVDASHMMPDRGEADTSDQAHVTTADDGDSQA
jgi:hypothetical protein